MPLPGLKFGTQLTLSIQRSYTGQWGDEQYPDSDPRQHKILGINAAAEFTSGPNGPEDKQLNRTDVCPTGEACVVRTALGP